MATLQAHTVKHFCFDTGCARSPRPAPSLVETWLRQWDTAMWTIVNAWPFCSVWLVVRGSTSALTTWRFSCEGTRGKHPHALHQERNCQRRQGITVFLCVSCGFHLSSYVGVCLAVLLRRKGTLGCWKERATAAVSQSVVVPHRKGETHDMSRTVFPISCALRCPFFLSRGGCEADGVTEARDDEQAYHQLQSMCVPKQEVESTSCSFHLVDTVIK